MITTQNKVYFLNYAKRLLQRSPGAIYNKSITIITPKNFSRKETENLYKKMYKFNVQKTRVINERQIIVKSNKKLIKRKNYKKIQLLL